MDYNGAYPRFMDASYYRSAPCTPVGYASDPRSPRFAAPVDLETGLKADYFCANVNDPYGAIYSPRSTYEHGSYGHGIGSVFGVVDLVRRTNAQAHIANGSITRSSMHVEIHPKMTLDGHYPNEFRMPLRLEKLLRMSERHLLRILMAYELPMDGRSYRDSSAGSLFEDITYGMSKASKLSMLMVLFEFLGALHLAEQLRRNSRDASLMRRPNYRLLGWDD